MTTTRHRVAIFCLLPFAALLSGCDDGGSGVLATTTDEALAPREVRLIGPEARDEQPSIELVGEIRAFDSVTVSSEVAGIVDRVLVEVGDRVAAGQALAEVDRATYRIYLDQAEANLEAARADLALTDKELERKRDLRSDETISQAAFDQASANRDQAAARVAAAEAALALAQRNFDRSVVRAPAAGAITQRFATGGQWAEVGVGLFELAVGGKIKVAARVPEAWARRLAGLETFEFSVGAGGATHTAKVYSVQPAVEGASRSFEIVGTAPADGSMKPGMFATVNLTSPAAATSLWLPASAVATSDLPQVLMVEDGVIAFRKVQIGRRADGSIEIVDGLTADERVVADVSGLTRGIPVTVVG
jgi:RND family efflux transporter MFP subunit